MNELETRAAAAWASLAAAFVRTDRDGRIELLETPRGKRAPVWPYGQVLAAAIDLGRLTGDAREAERLVDGLVAYVRGDGYVPAPRQRRRYYDDNAWIGLALMQLHRQSGDVEHLDHGRRVFGFVRAGADADGGVRWVEGRRSRNACAAAPAAQLALWLHRADEVPDALAFARRAMAWLDRTLVLPSGLVADHEDRGRIDPTIWSYNQGTAVGAWTLLHRATGDREALERASALAEISLRHFSGDLLWAQAPVFNAIWFRNLLALHAIAPLPGLIGSLDTYLHRAWREARDPSSGLFTAGGIGSYDGRPAIDQAGLVQLFALRAWPQHTWSDIA